MNLTEPQKHAILEIGGSEQAHGFIPQRVLDELLTRDVIRWRSDADVEFTEFGQQVYDELVGSA